MDLFGNTKYAIRSLSLSTSYLFFFYFLCVFSFWECCSSFRLSLVCSLYTYLIKCNQFIFGLKNKWVRTSCYRIYVHIFPLGYLFCSCFLFIWLYIIFGLLLSFDSWFCSYSTIVCRFMVFGRRYCCLEHLVILVITFLYNTKLNLKFPIVSLSLLIFFTSMHFRM